MKSTRLASAGTLLILLLAPASAGAKTLIGSGSTSAQPYLEALFQGYKKVDPSVQFVYTGDGGNAGVKDVQAGRSQFAGQSRPPLPSDAGTTYVKLFLDGLCLDVNPSNKLSGLSVAQAAGIFTGSLTNWSQIPGSRLNSTIDAVGRNSTAGSFTFFTSAILGGQTQGSNVNTLASDGLIANAVKQDPNAIGYAGLAYQKSSGLKKLSLGGFACEPRFIKSLQYPLSRFIWLVLPTANPDPDVQKFAEWVRSSPEAGAIISAGGAVPAFNQGSSPKKHKSHKHKKGRHGLRKH
jgi:phosphate transport system substrate-binding protein